MRRQRGNNYCTAAQAVKAEAESLCSTASPCGRGPWSPTARHIALGRVHLCRPYPDSQWRDAACRRLLDVRTVV